MSMRQLKISQSITLHESQCLSKYLLEIKKMELISSEEETHLATLIIRQGDKYALDRLIKANLRFVVSVAKQYQHQGLSLSDLINEGNIGLIKAAGNFDPSRGFKFISYAVWWIRQHIVTAIAENARIVRLPMNKVILRGRALKASSVLEQKLERSASVEELAEELELSPEEVRVGLSVNEKHLSLDKPLTEDGEDNMIDILENTNAVSSDNEVTHHLSLKIEIERSFKSLNERQKETICCFFGIGIDQPMSLEDIAQKFYISTERVRQIKDKAIDILRANGNISLLKSFLAA